MTSVSMQLVEGTDVRRFYGLAPLSLRPSIEAGHVPPNFLLLALYAGGQPAGLLTSFVAPCSQSAVLRSVAVGPRFRRRGFATTLMLHFEEEVKRRGYSLMELTLMRDEASVPESIQGMLRNAGWPAVTPTSLNCTAEFASISQAPWMAERDIGQDFDYCLWREVGAAKRSEILGRQQQQSYFACDLSPFLFEEEIDLSTSLALLHRGAVVGWCIMRRIDEVTTQCASLFVEQQYQKMGRAVWLLARCIDLHRHTLMHNGLFDVKLERPAMVSFVCRRMRPYLKSIRYTSRARKEVDSTPRLSAPWAREGNAAPVEAVVCV
jgi:GNAT superfamily N-acetyltransferase